MRDPIYVAAALCAFTVLAELLARRTWLRHVGTALLVILVTALAVVTTLWMGATLVLPRLLAPFWRTVVARPTGALDMDRDIADDTESVHPLDLFILAALGLTTLHASNLLAAATGIPSILILTAAALALAQLPLVARLRGARVLGMVSVLLFLAVIGAFADVRQLMALGRLGPLLLAFAAVLVTVHGIIIFGAARLLRLDLDIAAVASQANVGGSTSALALARSLGRADLVLPAVLIGALGNALGTFFGFWVAAMVR